MTQAQTDRFKKIIQRHFSGQPGDKARRYVGAFFNRSRIENKISAQVEGNHGTYTVSIRAEEEDVTSACSCYIGKYGGCHHVAALAVTFLDSPGSFKEIRPKKLEAVQSLPELHDYLKSVTLDALIKELRANGITQKAFAESVGMSSRHLSAVKSSELRNRTFHELGATKLACLWVLEHIARKT